MWEFEADVFSFPVFYFHWRVSFRDPDRDPTHTFGLAWRVCRVEGNPTTRKNYLFHQQVLNLSLKWAGKESFVGLIEWNLRVGMFRLLAKTNWHSEAVLKHVYLYIDRTDMFLVLVNQLFLGWKIIGSLLALVWTHFYFHCLKQFLTATYFCQCSYLSEWNSCS